MTKKQPKVLNLNTCYIDLMLDAATMNNHVKTNTLNMHDQSGLHHLMGLSKNGFGFLDFAICKIFCFVHDFLTCVPMHLLPLG